MAPRVIDRASAAGSSKHTSRAVAKRQVDIDTDGDDFVCVGMTPAPEYVPDSESDDGGPTTWKKRKSSASTSAGNERPKSKSTKPKAPKSPEPKASTSKSKPNTLKGPKNKGKGKNKTDTETKYLAPDTKKWTGAELEALLIAALGEVGPAKFNDAVPGHKSAHAFIMWHKTIYPFLVKALHERARE